MKSRRRIAAPRLRSTPITALITSGFCDRRNGVYRPICGAKILDCPCPLWVKSRHLRVCAMSALPPKADIAAMPLALDEQGKASDHKVAGLLCVKSAASCQYRKDAPTPYPCTPNINGNGPTLLGRVLASISRRRAVGVGLERRVHHVERRRRHADLASQGHHLAGEPGQLQAVAAQQIDRHRRHHFRRKIANDL
jgi:hypothetical protein